MPSVKTFFVHKPLPWIILTITLVGFLLRVSAGPDYFIWSYDQARDAAISESMIRDNNIVLRGPQTEFPGLTHGPLIYWMLAPWYYLSQGDPNLPGLFMILLNLSGIIPVCILARKLTKSSIAAVFAGLMYAFSYEQNEYSRFISNVSISIPFLSWFFLGMWDLFSSPKSSTKSLILAGISLGLAVQGEFFLIYWGFWVTLYFISQKKPFTQWLMIVGGGIIGILPMILAEIKFHFLGVRIFFTEFAASHTVSPIQAMDALIDYLNHLAFVAQNSLLGTTRPMAFFALIILFLYVKYLIKKNIYRRELVFLCLLFFAHSLLFTFKYVQAVFLDLGVGVLLISITSVVLNHLKATQRPLVLICLLTILGSQMFLHMRTVRQQTPFELYNFIQEGILFRQKIEVAKKSAELARTLSPLEPFTFASLGTPYEVRTVWSSIWSQIDRRDIPSPNGWHGKVAHGYPNESILPKIDAPGKAHILIIEPSQNLLPSTIRSEFLDDQNRTTELVEETILHGFTIQLRKARI